MKQEQQAVLQLPAGRDSEGKQVIERVEVYVLEKDGHFELKASPLFVRNLARGDVIFVDEEKPDTFSIVERSGNLALRVFRKNDIHELENRLTPEVEKLDGNLDLKTKRALSYSLHVNLGFAAIESLFDNVMAQYPDSVWYYGNVYDPNDGTTALNWWDSFINQV